MNILKAAQCHQLLELASLLQKQDSHSFDFKWNKLYLVQVAQIARLHSIYMSGKAFVDGINNVEMKKENKSALDTL